MAKSAQKLLELKLWPNLNQIVTKLKKKLILTKLKKSNCDSINSGSSDSSSSDSSNSDIF